jgi:hypothetical protein
VALAEDVLNDVPEVWSLFDDPSVSGLGPKLTEGESLLRSGELDGNLGAQFAKEILKPLPISCSHGQVKVIPDVGEHFNVHRVGDRELLQEIANETGIRLRQEREITHRLFGFENDVHGSFDRDWSSRLSHSFARVSTVYRHSLVMRKK